MTKFSFNIIYSLNRKRFVFIFALSFWIIINNLISPFIISLFFVGCFTQSSDNVEGLIPRDSFKSVLIDIEKNQNLLKLEIDAVNNTNQDSTLLETVLINYNYSTVIYQKTLLFYIDRPEEMLKLLHEVKDSLAS